MPVLHVRLLLICLLSSGVVFAAISFGEWQQPEVHAAPSAPNVHSVRDLVPDREIAEVVNTSRVCAACGDVVPDNVEASSLAGKSWIFCSGVCVETVAQDPARYFQFSNE